MNVKSNSIEYIPIGVIHSPYRSEGDAPRQSFLAEDGESAVIEIFKKFCDGLKDLDKINHIVVVYHLHLSDGYSLKTIGNNGLRGVFATRSPRRPNPIGISVVKILSIDGCFITIDKIDAVDGTPVLDIKPFYEEIDGVR